MINKDLSIPEKEFVNNFTNDFIGTDFIEQLDYGMLLIQSKFNQFYLREYNEYVTRNTFDKAFIINSGLKEDMSFFRPLSGLQATPEMFPNLNIKMFVIDDSITLVKVKELSPIEKRGLYIKKKHAYKISWAVYNKDKDAFYGSTEGLEVNDSFFMLNVNNFSEINPTSLKDIPTPFSLTKGIRLIENAVLYQSEDTVKQNISWISMAYQIAFSLYYEWTIYLKEYDNIGITVPIDPFILKELYNSSILDFDTRKKMLHFVRDYYRRKISSSEYDYTVYVRKYLRGENKFNYRGFKAEIIPPKYDLNRVTTRKKFIDPLT